MTIVLIARLVLAAVFTVAAVAKLADRRGTRSGVLSFGAPERVASALAICLPLAELAVAGLLVPASTALYGAVGALVLLALFSAAIAWNLLRGRRPDCHCFGQLHSAPTSWKTFGRNVVLMAIAVLALVGNTIAEPTSATAWTTDLSATELLALGVAATAVAVLAIGGAAFVALMRSYGHVLTRLDRVEAALVNAGLSLDDELEMPEIGLAPGSRLPFFAATAVGGEEVTSATLADAGTPSLLLFTSPRCGPCAALMPTVAEWQRDHAGRLTVVVASAGTAAEVVEETQQHGLEHVLHDGDSRLAELFHANGTPSAVLVAPDGTIGSWVASGSEWIEQVVEGVVGGGGEGGLPVGAEAPALELPSLTGEMFSLASLRGRDTLLLFWNPDCSYCNSMRADVHAWEASAIGTGPQLVVVSSGGAAKTREEGFGSLVLLDEDFVAGSAFEATGTPMAVRLDADGRIASQVVAGADAVLALATTPVEA